MKCYSSCRVDADRVFSRPDMHPQGLHLLTLPLSTYRNAHLIATDPHWKHPAAQCSSSCSHSWILARRTSGVSEAIIKTISKDSTAQIPTVSLRVDYDSQCSVALC